MKNDPDSNSFLKDFITCLIIAGAMVVFCLLLSSCSFFRKVAMTKDEVKSDSSSVKKETEKLNKVDTSKSKSESTYTKETIYFGRDTTINNFYTTPSPAVIIRESGTKKEETNNYNYETRERQLIDSMRIANLELQLSKKTETKVKVLDFWQILALGILGLIVLYFVANKFITFKK
jgi:hypothetical protein